MQGLLVLGVERWCETLRATAKQAVPSKVTLVGTGRCPPVSQPCAVSRCAASDVPWRSKRRDLF